MVRKSPSESATSYQVNTQKVGNDGNTWIVKENKNGVKRWVLVTPSRGQVSPKVLTRKWDTVYPKNFKFTIYFKLFLSDIKSLRDFRLTDRNKNSYPFLKNKKRVLDISKDILGSLFHLIKMSYDYDTMILKVKGSFQRKNFQLPPEDDVILYRVTYKKEKKIQFDREKVKKYLLNALNAYFGNSRKLVGKMADDTWSGGDIWFDERYSLGLNFYKLEFASSK